ncbi:MAG: cytochrome d ubiquinol oxidase subunit II [Chloroflexota bacterium]
MTATLAADLVLALLWLALTAYVVLAGADFGGGVWDALARGPSAPEQRRLVAEAMGPVWEANHVWLIAMITGLFTTFPLAFAALSLALYVPLSIALIGIVLRGAAFAFRAHGAAAVGATTPWGVLFGAASIITPALLGASAAAAASGAIRVSSAGRVTLSPALPWLTPFALDCALLGLALSAQQAAVYLAVEADDAGEPVLRRHFQRRTLITLGVTSGAALTGLPLAHVWAPVLATGLTGRALPLVVLVILASAGCALAVARGHVRWGRALAVVEASGIVWAWGVAQYPYLIVPDVTVANSAASSVTLLSFVAIAVGGGVLLIPALWLLFAVFKGRNPAQS